MNSQIELPIIPFNTQKKWRNWLTKTYTDQKGIWLRIYKKDSGVKSITYDEALDEALCFGWIDGLRKKFDEKSYIQKFTPRRKKSLWSKRNKEKAEWLIKEGKMQKAGQAEIKKAKENGRWDNAYDSGSTMKVPKDFLMALSSKHDALSFFNNLDKTNKYSITWRLQTATTPGKRQKRMKEIIKMLSKGEKFH